jgi:hypothetical protein
MQTGLILSLAELPGIDLGGIADGEIPDDWATWKAGGDARRDGAMANDRGLLPKARREDLPDELRRRLDRWYRDAYEDDNLFLTMARRPGLLDATMGFVRYAYGGASSIEPELFEIVRVRLAWKNRCVH